MPEKWTGKLVGVMHNERITYDELANEMGITKAYVSMLLNGSRKTNGIRERMEAAVATIIQRRNTGTADTHIYPNGERSKGPSNERK